MPPKPIEITLRFDGALVEKEIEKMIREGTDRAMKGLIHEKEKRWPPRFKLSCSRSEWTEWKRKVKGPGNFPWEMRKIEWTVDQSVVGWFLFRGLEGGPFFFLHPFGRCEIGVFKSSSKNLEQAVYYTFANCTHWVRLHEIKTHEQALGVFRQIISVMGMEYLEDFLV